MQTCLTLVLVFEEVQIGSGKTKTVEGLEPLQGTQEEVKKKRNIKEYFSLLLKSSIRHNNRHEKCLHFLTFTVHSHLLEIFNHQDVFQNRSIATK